MPKIYFLLSYQIRDKSTSIGTENNAFQREKSRLGSIDKQFSSLSFPSSGILSPTSSIKVAELGAPGNNFALSAVLPTLAEGDEEGKNGKESLIANPSSSETAKLLVDASTQTLDQEG